MRFSNRDYVLSSSLQFANFFSKIIDTVFITSTISSIKHD